DFLMDAIRKNRGDGKPFLGYLAFTAPHDPVHAPEPWLSKYRGTYDAGYEALKSERWNSAKKIGIVPQAAQLAARHPSIRAWSALGKDEQALEARGMEVYAGMLEAMDYHYGRVVDFLKDIGEYDNTIIIFLSDNGANPWYSADYPEAKEEAFRSKFDNSLENIGNPRSNYAYGMGFASGSGGPLDKFKMTFGEGGIRSPLLVSGPGVKKGRRSDAFVYVTDIMPTLLELTGVKFPVTFKGRKIEPMRGRSMAGLLDGSKAAIYDDEEFIGGEMGGGKWMRQGSLKAIMVPKPYGNGKWRLHDVSKDPGEANDLSQAMPKKLKALQAAWDQYANDVGVIAPE
ncbi:MAG: sulfatase-like hydrolase/transferase, partial [Hyphomicrobiaceae bacterium]